MPETSPRLQTRQSRTTAYSLLVPSLENFPVDPRFEGCRSNPKLTCQEWRCRFQKYEGCSGSHDGLLLKSAIKEVFRSSGNHAARIAESISSRISDLEKPHSRSRRRYSSAKRV